MHGTGHWTGYRIAVVKVIRSPLWRASYQRHLASKLHGNSTAQITMATFPLRARVLTPLAERRNYKLTLELVDASLGVGDAQRGAFL